ncbi:uncharacterized protein TRIADDRAFT_61631 [Trichoplax adhaerens]|uniref:F-box domain-containing protein n=1 Tax=Trichoplax adhaerens TaxID=10228 RepID=B3SBI8_TRIAD|nr:predicted protein [Trichoplax adhaerens]EDV19861.1 predicted protein [Trichoplax adhaerens]|eukprot:XP_002117603.1 predicted protein [Trichoplax adhaerens]
MTKRKYPMRKNARKLKRPLEGPSDSISTTCLSRYRKETNSFSFPICSQRSEIYLFERLPLEILHYILDFLTVDDLQTFASASNPFDIWTLGYLKRTTVIKKIFNLSLLKCTTEDKQKITVNCTAITRLRSRFKMQTKLNTLYDALGKTWAVASSNFQQKERYKLLAYVLKILVSTFTEILCHYASDHNCFFYIACAKFIDKFTSMWPQEDKLSAYEYILEYDYFHNKIKSTLFNLKFPVAIKNENHEIFHIRHFFRDIFLDRYRNIERGIRLSIALKPWPIFIQARLIYMLYASPILLKEWQIQTDEAVAFGEVFKCLKLTADDDNHKFKDDDWISILWDLREAASEVWLENYLPLILLYGGEQVYTTYLTTKLSCGRLEEVCGLVISLIIILWENVAPERCCRTWLLKLLKKIEQELPDKYKLFIRALFRYFRHEIAINAFPVNDWNKG